MTEIEYKHTYAGEPSAPPSIYPRLDEGHVVRCQKIMEIEGDLRKEIIFRSRLYKHYSRTSSLATGIDAFVGVASLGVDITAVAITGTVVGAPVGVILGGVGIGLGAVAIACIPAVVKLGLKAKKHLSIKNIAESKLNTIRDHYSRALTDSHCSHEEFKIITDEWEKYLEMKSQMKKKIQSEISNIKNEDFMKSVQNKVVEDLAELKKKRNELDQQEAEIRKRLK